MQLPTNRAAGNTRAEHLADHNELARLHNLYDDDTDTPAVGDVPTWDGARYAAAPGGAFVGVTDGIQGEVELSATQAVANSGDHHIDMDTNTSTDGTVYDYGPAPSYANNTLLILQAGLYVVSVEADWTSDATGTRRFRPCLLSTTGHLLPLAFQQRAGAGLAADGDFQIFEGLICVPDAVGWALDIRVRQTTAGSLDLTYANIDITQVAA